jgi:hypothetical protein
MKTNAINASAYPPPPPPPPPAPAKSRKTLVVALLLVLVVASALALAYMATGGFNLQGGNNTNPSPSASPSGFATASPSASPTATATSSSSSTPAHTATPSASATPTATPQTTPQPTSTSGGNNEGYANFRDGAWANYTIKTYDESGTVALETHLKESVDSGTYQGAACWLLTTAQDQTYGGYTSTTKTIYYLQKSNLQGLHVKIYYNDVLTSEYDLNQTTTTDPGTTGEIDPNTIVSYETITVPAGTFANCAKAQFTSPSGNANVWAHLDVPVFGLVKMTMYSGTTLSMSEELTAYGG